MGRDRKRLKAAAAGDFVVALYNPRSKGRDWQLEKAKGFWSNAMVPHPSSWPVNLAVLRRNWSYNTGKAEPRGRGHVDCAFDWQQRNVCP